MDHDSISGAEAFIEAGHIAGMETTIGVECILNGNFCVITIADLKLDSARREQFAEHILMEYDIHTYITDILYKNHMVLICILKDEKHETATNLAMKIKRYLYSQNGVSYKIGVGHIVSQLDDIHKSYMNALYSMESAASSATASNAEISVIENYPSEYITLFLQYVQNAQLDNALKILDEIIQYIINKIDTVLLQRYICYDILTAYFKCLKQINYPISKKETSDLLAHNNVSELYDALSASVKRVCESIANRNDGIYNSLQKDILDYVNENFTDPDICRTQVADHFGISIYSLSRLFKDSIGIGFTEYVTAKRMELSRQLLLTTDESIAQIASQIGINDPNYFSKLFKSTYNITPSKFRSQQ
jgi:two-component system response regulator YesN